MIPGNTPNASKSTILDISALSSTGVIKPTCASGSKPKNGNKKNDRIPQTRDSAKKNKVEDQSRSSNSNKSSMSVKPVESASVQNSKPKVVAKSLCNECGGCLFSDIHFDLCFAKSVKSLNAKI